MRIYARVIVSVSFMIGLSVNLQGQTPNIWINEFHYDNDGTDTGESVEVVAPENYSNMAAITLSLYNGNGGGVYNSETLDNFTQGNTINGHTFYSISISGIQNGPDGFALDSAGTLIQFISYEGTVTATAGPANGQTSNDIGVSESGSSPLGHSLQLEGIGDQYSDFTWIGPDTSTSGEMNFKQTIGATTTPNIIISEFMADPDAVNDSEGEWFEIYNASDITVNINGWIIKDLGSDDQPIESSSSLVFQSGEFLVLADNSNSSINGGVNVDYEYPSYTLTNSDDEIIIYLSDGTTEVDRIEYGISGWPSVPSGASLAFTGNPSDDNNIGSNWIDSTTIWSGSAGDKGSPGTNGKDQSLPVTLTSFSAEVKSGTVELSWVTESEVRNQGFVVERKTSESGKFVELSSFRTNPGLKGAGSTSERNSYQFTDEQVQAGKTYWYRLKDVSFEGKVTTHNDRVLEVTAENQDYNSIELQPPFPNPFNSQTRLTYQLPEATQVVFELYDIRGVKLTNLFEARQTAGSHDLFVSLPDYPSGVYFVRMNAGQIHQVQKLVLIK